MKVRVGGAGEVATAICSPEDLKCSYLNFTQFSHAMPLAGNGLFVARILPLGFRGVSYLETCRTMC